MTDSRTPLDAALDLVLFAPVGLALTISEEVPKLAAKGRSKVSSRVTTAKMVGQFAVAQGRREVERRFQPSTPTPVAPPPSGPIRPGLVSSGPAGTTPGAATAGGTTPGGAAGGPGRSAPGSAAPRSGVSRSEMPGSGASGPGGSVAPGSAGSGADGPGGVGAARRRPPAAAAPEESGGRSERDGRPSGAAGEGLAIPGYDTLSASQVVQRLAGLAPSELESVKTYEASTRGRRTILARIGQLQG